MKLVAIQLTSGADWPANRAAIAAQLAALPPQRPCLVLLPENAACLGRPADYAALAEPLGEGPVQAQLAQWAREFGIWLVMGAMPIQSDCPRPYTSSLVYDDQGVRRGHYHKIHLFDVDVPDGHGRYRESDSFSAGSEPVVVSSPFGGLGLSICYDVRFPELYRRLRQAGADILLVPAAFTQVTGQAHWLPLLQARAIENQCLVLAANQWGHHGGDRHTWGHSLILDGWGQLLACRAEGVGQVVADLPLDQLADIRRRMPVLQHARLLPGQRDESCC